MRKCSNCKGTGIDGRFGGWACKDCKGRGFVPEEDKPDIDAGALLFALFDLVLMGWLFLFMFA